AQIHAHRIIRALGRLLGLGLSRDLLLDLDQSAALALSLFVGLLARLLALFARLLGLGEVEQRVVRRGLGTLLLRHLILLRRRLDVACHEPPRPALMADQLM